jgi:hypothetical protein
VAGGDGCGRVSVGVTGEMSGSDKHVVRRGKTPVLTEDQARRLLESLDTSTLIGQRDRAPIGVMTYAFARIGAVVAMKGRGLLPRR